MVVCRPQLHFVMWREQSVKVSEKKIKQLKIQNLRTLNINYCLLFMSIILNIYNNLVITNFLTAVHCWPGLYCFSTRMYSNYYNF